MLRKILSLFLLVGAVMGAEGVARACYYQAFTISLDGCTMTWAQVCSTNADGTGQLYYTGRVRFTPYYLCA
jgi:hypothetical protein